MAKKTPHSDLVDYGIAKRTIETERNEYGKEATYSDADIKDVKVEDMGRIDVTYSKLDNENPGQIVIY